MSSKQIETLFKVFDESSIMLQKELDVSYLEALAETGENLLSQGEINVQDGLPTEQTITALSALYHSVDLTVLEAEDIRKAFQLALLKGAREDKIQANHQMTPDAIGFIIAYLVEKLAGHQQQLRILDPAVGTGNLLSTVYNSLGLKKIQVTGEGIDVDDLLLNLAYIGISLQQQKIKLTHQDGMQDLLVDPVDFVVSDLPVGYYPNDERAKDFKTAAEAGHSYAHHLLIEQSLKYLTPGGYGIFLAPSNIFDSVEAPALQKLILAESYLQGILHLPKGLFKTESSRKSILFVQKKGSSVKKVNQVLLAEIPDFKNQQAMLHFMQEVDVWYKENKTN